MTVAWSTLQRLGLGVHPRHDRTRGGAMARSGRLPRTDTTGTAGAILDLQRTAGNHAVTELLSHRAGGRPLVQRDITLTPSDLNGDPPGKASKRLRGTFGTLIEALRDFHAASERRERLMYANVIVGLSTLWLDGHASSSSKKDVPRLPLVTRLRNEARNEAFKLRAEFKRERTNQQVQSRYLADVDKGSFEGSREYGHLATPDAKELAAGSTPGGLGSKEGAADLVAKYHLTAAELTAIRIYSMADYLYINPAIVKSKSWMAESVGGVKEKYKFGKVDLKKLESEGTSHALMMLEGLRKLDPYTKPTYRGERLKKEKFDEKYGKGASPGFGAFGSSSKNPDIARDFANGERGNKRPEKDQTVSVFATVNPKTARDISEISTVPDEEEVLILPGTKFNVDDDQEFKPGPEGWAGAKATEWHRVTLSEK